MVIGAVSKVLLCAMAGIFAAGGITMLAALAILDSAYRVYERSRRW